MAVAGTLCFLVAGMRLVASSLALSIERESCGGGSSMSCPAWAVICCPLSLAKNKERCQKVDDTRLHSTARRAFGQLRLQLLELVPFPGQLRPVQRRRRRQRRHVAKRGANLADCIRLAAGQAVFVIFVLVAACAVSAAASAVSAAAAAALANHKNIYVN